MSEIIWATLAAFVGFEVALGINYLALRALLRAMNLGLRPQPVRRGASDANPELR